MFIELATALLGASTFTVAAQLWRTQTRLQKINRFLEEGQPQAFLDAIDKELMRSHGRALIALLRINQAAGFVYVGDFEQGLRRLRLVDLNDLKAWHSSARRRIEALYHNNLLLTLLLGGHYDEAIALWESASAHFIPRTYHTALDQCLQGTAASFHYFCGDRFTARKALEELTQLQSSNLVRGHRLYFLGRIDLAEGYFERGMERIQSAASLVPNGYLAEEPKRLADGQERIPGPGAGSHAPRS
jgi:tetratricopeptide (TPR) repeat protein